MQGAVAVPRLALAARGVMLVNAEREAGKLAASWWSAERTSLAVEVCVGSSAELRDNWQNAGQTSLASCLGRTRSAVLSREERRFEVRRLVHHVQGCRPCATCAATNVGACRPTARLVAAGGGRKPTPLRCHLKKNRGRLDGKTLERLSERFVQDCKVAKSTSLKQRHVSGDRAETEYLLADLPIKLVLGAANFCGVSQT